MGARDSDDKKFDVLARLRNIPRYYKRTLLTFIDLVLLSAALWVAFSLRFGTIYVPPEEPEMLLLMFAAPLISVAVLWWLGVYRRVTRYIGYSGLSQVIMGIGLATLVWALVVFMVGQAGIPRTVVILFGVIAALFLTLARYGIKLVLESSNFRLPRRKVAFPPRHAVIYGAGVMGTRLLSDARHARDRVIVGFVDPSPTLWRQYVDGVKVHSPSRLLRLIERHEVTEVLVALPASQRRERREVLQELERLPVAVKILPAYEDVASGDVGLNNLREVEVADLLGRDPVKPVGELIERSIKGKAILVTGAGGSIGSELVRQIIKQAPRLIVLFDISEHALYTVELETRELIAKRYGSSPPIVKAVLGSVLDLESVANVIENNGIEAIYHAAAYKHVPLVEENPFVGLDNNVFGTQVVAEAASKFEVERFVLVSTDKAVRPTNIMGASKRLAELVLQASAGDKTAPIFSVVRFGNVLDSSGSVVPRFREQIRRGGPVTVTHPEVTRYFMSIPEAAELVIQAGAMAHGGEVFVLQMGDPVRIADLARLMVHLSNLEVRDENHPDGDIEISYIGLRPGEKLYEELLINDDAEPTEHPRIFKSNEPFLPSVELEAELDQLRQAMKKRDRSAIQGILMRTVEGYQSRSEDEALVSSGGSPPAPAVWEEITSRTMH